MITPTHELLRKLLPRYFWLRDAEAGGGVLDALVRGLAEQYDELRLDIDLLYDDFFIATCDPQYVPLIGDGIGVTGLAPVEGPGVGDRAWVGRTISLRRRKGTLATVARGVIAATGWAAYIQEGRAVLSTTSSMLDPRSSARPVDVAGRRPRPIGEPWSPVARGASISGRPIIAGDPSPRPGPRCRLPGAPHRRALGLAPAQLPGDPPYGVAGPRRAATARRARVSLRPAWARYAAVRGRARRR